MEIAGYSASILIGISLGLIGGGGSILTVPVLVYLFHLDAVVATAYSLFIVGATSVVGAVSYLKNRMVNLKTAVIFGVPSVLTVFWSRAYIVPLVPDEIITIGNLLITRNILLMLFFAMLMIIASYNMIRSNKHKVSDIESTQPLNYPMIAFQGAIVGVLTGLVGVGGGFLIIPALVLLCRLPMKEAVGTSLLIIASKSLIGFWGESSETLVNWPLLLSITTFAILGILLGFTIAKKIKGEKLKPAFGWFILAMGIYIILRETVLK